jgi:hypothetical protein
VRSYRARPSLAVFNTYLLASPASMQTNSTASISVHSTDILMQELPLGIGLTEGLINGFRTIKILINIPVLELDLQGERFSFVAKSRDVT